MLAKAALSLALAHDPELLILDEPTSGLDPLVRREFLEQMVDRAAAGKTVFLSSHQIAEVERVADMVAILRGGKLVVVEKLEVLKDQIRELTFTLGDELAEPPRVPGEVLRQQRRARQWQLHARHLSDTDIAAARIVTGVVDLEVRRPSLEEVYVAFMRGNSMNSSVTPNTEVPA
jgi:ABC-2 type transport system ATP-binding protein